MDEVCARAASDYLKEGPPGGALLLAEFDGMRSVVSEDTVRAVEILKAEFKTEAKVVTAPAERERLWRVRRAALYGLMGLRPTALIEDVTVPRSKLPVMVGEIAKAAAKHNIQVAVFGHAGDGNLHPVFLTDSKDGEEMGRVKSAVSAVRQVCVDLEGVVSAEKGVGLDREPYRKLELGQSGYEVMKSVKDSLDSKGVMNPGKMFNED
jgi:glycolate oxidase